MPNFLAKVNELELNLKFLCGLFIHLFCLEYLYFIKQLKKTKTLPL